MTAPIVLPAGMTEADLLRSVLRQVLQAAQANAEAPKHAKASEVADDGAVLPCGCVPPCEGHHEDVS